MSFDEILREKAGHAEAVIRRYLPEAEGEQKNLINALLYSMESGGKKIRPVLMEESFRMFGGRSEMVYPFMAAIEMIHTHSLIHDDLPSIDNDEYRRGRKTTHAVYGEPAALLAGDALLNYAYETALCAFEMADTEEETSRVIRALMILSHKTGIYGMLGGQGVDVENDKRSDIPMSPERLSFIYEHKTGALLEAPLMIGAVLAGADEKDVRRMEQIGSKVGRAFQIQDDILDVTGDEKELGKPVHSDEKNEKITSVVYLGGDGASARVQELTEEAVSLLDEIPLKNEFLRQLLVWMASRRK